MKLKIAKKAVLPQLYGIAAAWVITGVLVVLALVVLFGTPVIQAVLSVSAVLLLALFPAACRSATVYSSALIYHKAEYMYDLGNGVEASLAVDTYERKAKRAVAAWLKRKLLKGSFGVLPVTFFVLLMGGVGFMHPLEIAVLLGITVVISVMISLFVMLYSARRYCFDKFGNIKNN